MIPPVLQDLVDMARCHPDVLKRHGKGKTVKASMKALEDAFEDRLRDALTMAGLSVRQLGHKAPGKREPDGIAVCPNDKSFALMYDGKVSKKGYRFSAKDDRALVEYIKKWDSKLEKKGYDRLYLGIISCEFKGNFKAGIGKLKKRAYGTALHSVVLIPADILLYIVQVKLDNPRIDRIFFGEVFEREGVLTSKHIDDVLKEQARDWEVL